MTRTSIPCLLSLFAALLFSSTAFAEHEFGIIEDTDGYVNVRSKPDLGGKVVARIDDGEFVWISEAANEKWWEVVYYKNRIETVGFVHKSRVKLLSGFEKLPDGKEARDQIVFQNGDLKIEISSEAFDKNSVSISTTREPGGGQWGSSIDDKPFFGADGGLPRRKYRHIIISDGAATITIPDEAIADLYEPNLSNYGVRIFRDRATATLYLSFSNSDGAGGYEAVLKIVAGRQVHWSTRFVS